VLIPGTTPEGTQMPRAQQVTIDLLAGYFDAMGKDSTRPFLTDDFCAATKS